jgi:hypothetical protein
MSEILITLDGYGRATLSLDLVDAAGENEIEVWRGIFKEDNDAPETLWEVYFEMDPTIGYEVWDLINEAIYTYKMEAEAIQ